MIVGVYRLQLTVIRSEALRHGRHRSKVYWVQKIQQAF
jgi:hypothetical protein